MSDPLSRRLHKPHANSKEEGHCPIPSAHDKLGEAHYFIHELIENYHHPDEFRYSLSAFFQAARSTTLMIQSELANLANFQDWWEPNQEEMRKEPDLKLLNNCRIESFHKNSLVPASEMFVGHFKYGKPRTGLLMPLHPMVATLSAFLYARRTFSDWEHPHRLWSGEEFGIQRCWKLEEIPNQELVQFCIACWEKIAHVISETHSWLGFTFEPEAKCKHWGTDYRNVRESEIFPEVAKAWDSHPTELVSPKKGPLKLLADPWDGSDAYFQIEPGSTVKGWVGMQSRFWDSAYISMLVYSIDQAVISTNTCVFFKITEANIEPLDETSDQDGTLQSEEEDKNSY